MRRFRLKIENIAFKVRGKKFDNYTDPNNNYLLFIDINYENYGQTAAWRA